MGRIMGFTVACELCGEHYKNYHTTLITAGKVVCPNCFVKAKDEAIYWYVPHIPGFCDGCKTTLTTFDTKEQLLEFLKNIPKENETLAISDDNTIMTVTKDGKFWWVHGYVKDTSILDLPDWKNLKKTE